MQIPVAVPPRRDANAADVVGIGQATADHLCVVDPFPTPDTKQRLVGHAMQPGGQVATALAALGRWGVRTAYAGAVGGDDAGRAARASLEAHGVDVGAAVVRPALATQLSVILVDARSGERTVLWHRAEGLDLAPDEVPLDRVVAARALLVDGADGAAARRAATAARGAGVPVVADLDLSCADAPALVPLVDVLLVSHEFARRYTGAAAPSDALAALAAAGPAVVGVTLGRDGVVARAAGRDFRQHAYPVTAVDTTGAGDLFHAGFLWGMLHGFALEDALRLANAAAALQCTRLGGREAIPALADARALAGL
ncbi:MAG TPA: PfkB family carbohydrate kinase [Candidatus Binatia bacterium]|nr:PfkB family carbohydrate kinase [Candidatus Binatia bacterium]